MSSYDKMLAEIIAMQSYAAQRPKTHAELLNQLARVRAELERLITHDL
jgi:hypothetical protein